jgi:spermidine synthase
MEEKTEWGKYTYTIQPNTSRVTFNTEHQKVDLITNPVFGRMLFLDGVLQSSTADEELYHKAIVGLGFQKRSTPIRNVLIAGGAEGGMLREIYGMGLDVQRAVMVDWDKQLISYLRIVERMNLPSFQDLRTEVIHRDIFEYSWECKIKFDTIYLDLLDPTEETIQWMYRLINTLYQNLGNQGCIVANAGGDKKTVEKMCNAIKQYSVQKPLTIETHTVDVPSFLRPWYLLRITYGTTL